MSSPQRILIVDDYEDHRLILRYHLRRIGAFNILEAIDGQQALDIVSQEPIDLVVMNLGLPVLDGWEAVRLIRALPSPACHVPIIAFTAYVMPSDRKRALDAGCNDYLEKPLMDFALLQQKVTRLLAKGRTP